MLTSLPCGGGGGGRALVLGDVGAQVASSSSHIARWLMKWSGGTPCQCEEFEYKTLLWKNIGIKGGVAPVRQYIAELLDDVLAGRIDPGLVFEYTTDLDHVADAYAAMDERRPIKSLLTTPSTSPLLPSRRR